MRRPVMMLPSPRSRTVPKPSLSPDKFRFGEKVADYVVRTVDSAGLKGFRTSKDHGFCVYVMDSQKHAFDVHVFLSENGVTAGIAYTKEQVVHGVPQATDGTGDVSRRTFRFAYNERFHVFGAGLRREIGYVVSPEPQQEDFREEPPSPTSDDLAQVIQSIMDSNPDMAAEKIAEVLTSVCGDATLESLRDAFYDCRQSHSPGSSTM